MCIERGRCTPGVLWCIHACLAPLDTSSSLSTVQLCHFIPKFCLEHISDNSILYLAISDCHEEHIADASCHDVKALAGSRQ